MWVSRVRVTGGFLADFDAQLAPGLNVVIGPRGAGKTTLLELLRHALGVRHADEGRDQRQAQLVKSLLGAGEVILDLRLGDEEFRVVVDASGAGRLESTRTSALMLGQNELEQIASSSESRLALIDLRASTTLRFSTALERAARTTRQLANIRAEREALVDQLRLRVSLLSDREALRAREDELMARGSAGLAAQRQDLAVRETELRQLDQWGVQEERFAEQILKVYELVTAARDAMADLPPDAMSPTLVQRTTSELDDLRAALFAADAHAQRIFESVTAVSESNNGRASKLRLEAAPIRASLDEAEKGLGDVTARLRNIEVQLGKLDLVDEQVAAIDRQCDQLRRVRDDAMATSEYEQEEVFEARLRVAETVSNQLSERVVVSVDHLADATQFREVLNGLLQGSGLQYRAISDAIARATLPRNLVEIVEDGDVEALSLMAGIPQSRAVRVLSHLDTAEALYDLARVQLEDRADFFLQDGSVRKGVESLSTGQKCAVTLPIALSEHSRALILDQPEDHLDNAYLVDTIVSALRDRTSSGAQTIVATHNANVPVLGEAQLVIAMSSDGMRGFVSRAGRFDDRPIVNMITGLMEGGAEAFQRRARFYRANASDFE